MASILEVTDDIRLVELVARDRGPLPGWSPGAHIRVAVGDGTTRAYSLMGPASETDRYHIAIRRDAGGTGGSLWMHALNAGDEVEILAPRNDFELAAGAGFTTLIAGGIGITPILSMARTLHARGAALRLIYCARSADHAAFVEELRVLLGDRLIEHYDGGDPARNYDFATLLRERGASEHLYVCGPAGLIEGVVAAAGHWPEGTVHLERFVNGETAGSEGFDIVLGRSGETVHVPPGKSILRVLLDRGMPLEYYCEAGNCGLCTTDVLQGAIEHHDIVLTDEEKASQTLMQICVSRPAPGETLVLDL
ncbi:PDR/VanB family oxidoreductase [Sphingobium chungangianum]